MFWCNITHAWFYYLHVILHSAPNAPSSVAEAVQVAFSSPPLTPLCFDNLLWFTFTFKWQWGRMFLCAKAQLVTASENTEWMNEGRVTSLQLFSHLLSSACLSSSITCKFFLSVTPAGRGLEASVSMSSAVVSQTELAASFSVDANRNGWYWYKNRAWLDSLQFYYPCTHQ